MNFLYLRLLQILINIRLKENHIVEENLFKTLDFKNGIYYKKYIEIKILW